MVKKKRTFQRWTGTDYVFPIFTPKKKRGPLGARIIIFSSFFSRFFYRDISEVGQRERGRELECSSDKKKCQRNKSCSLKKRNNTRESAAHAVFGASICAPERALNGAPFLTYIHRRSHFDRENERVRKKKINSRGCVGACETNIPPSSSWNFFFPFFQRITRQETVKEGEREKEKKVLMKKEEESSRHFPQRATRRMKKKGILERAVGYWIVGNPHEIITKKKVEPSSKIPLTLKFSLIRSSLVMSSLRLCMRTSTTGRTTRALISPNELWTLTPEGSHRLLVASADWEAPPHGIEGSDSNVRYRCMLHIRASETVCCFFSKVAIMQQVQGR